MDELSVSSRFQLVSFQDETDTVCLFSQGTPHLLDRIRRSTSLCTRPFALVTGMHYWSSLRNLLKSLK